MSRPPGSGPRPNDGSISGEPAPTGSQVVVESLYAILALGSVALYALTLRPSASTEFRELAEYIDWVICVLFFSKAAWDLWKSPNRKRWWHWGWSDFLASVPIVEPLRGFRAIRLVLILRVLRSATRAVHGFAALFRVGRAKTVAATVSSLIVISLILASFLILGLESRHPEANILTAEDALLWSVATFFGAEPTDFGDHHAVTAGGSLIAVWLKTLALGLIGSLAGLISNWIETGAEAADRG